MPTGDQHWTQVWTRSWLRGFPNSLPWYLFARLSVLLSLLFLLALQEVLLRREPGGNVLLAYSLLVAGFSINFAQSFWMGTREQRWGEVSSQILFDNLLITLWLVFAAESSTFATLYVLQILLVALIYHQRGALFSAALATLGFAFVTASHSGDASVWNWLVYGGLFLGVGLVGGYLAEELHRTNQQLEEETAKTDSLRALQESILKSLPTGLMTVGGDGNIFYINEAGAQLLHRASAELVGHPLSRVAPDLRPFFSSIEEAPVQGAEGEDVGKAEGGQLASTHEAAHTSYFVKTGSDTRAARLQQVVEIGYGSEQRVLRGDVAPLDTAQAAVGGLLDEKADSGRVLLFQDVTKLVRLEDRVRQSEKLAAIGQLAAGIAHEIRNPLASMSASLELLRGELPAAGLSDESARLMDIALREIERLNDLISEFLDFVRPDQLRLEPSPIAPLLKETRDAVALTLSVGNRSPVNFVSQIEEGCLALGSSAKLRQVFWNLILNATQAGAKTITVGCRVFKDHWVQIWIEDDGSGMSEKTRQHLFEPFFTTKPSGTGLGLATAYKIVEAHRGEIRVESKEGKGTRFEVILMRG